jgi:hypothetical protein
MTSIVFVHFFFHLYTFALMFVLTSCSFKQDVVTWQGNQENCEGVSFLRNFFEWQQMFSVVVPDATKELESGTISYVHKFH